MDKGSTRLPPTRGEGEGLARIIKPIVEGQITSFLKDHPEVAEGWNRRHSHRTKAEAVVNSVAKRISNDLLCEQTRVRLIAALLEPTIGSDADGAVGDSTAAHGGDLEGSAGSPLPAEPAEARR